MKLKHFILYNKICHSIYWLVLKWFKLYWNNFVHVSNWLVSEGLCIETASPPCDHSAPFCSVLHPCIGYKLFLYKNIFESELFYLLKIALNSMIRVPVLSSWSSSGFIFLALGLIPTGSVPSFLSQWLYEKMSINQWTKKYAIRPILFISLLPGGIKDIKKGGGNT